MNAQLLDNGSKRTYHSRPAATALDLPRESPRESKAARIEELPGTIRRLHKNEYLFQMGTRVNSLYVVCGGAVKCYIIAPDGDEQVVAFYRTGDMLAFDAFASDQANYNVVAIDATALKVIPANAVLKACREVPGIQQQLLQGMNREIRRLTGMLQWERGSAEQRLAAFLIEQSEFEAGRGCSRTDFILPMSRTELGKYLNLATETISRTFGRLQEQGLVATEGKRIQLKDFAGIRQLATMASAGMQKELCA